MPVNYSAHCYAAAPLLPAAVGFLLTHPAASHRTTHQNIHTQARTVAEPIIATVSLMADSGLPCFSRGAPVANLRNRFHLEMNDAQVGFWVLGFRSKGGPTTGWKDKSIPGSNRNGVSSIYVQLSSNGCFVLCGVAVCLCCCAAHRLLLS